MSKVQNAKPVTSNYGINRLKRLTKHLKLHPNDEQAKESLDSNKTLSTRKPSQNKGGWISSNKAIETILRSKFIGNISKEALKKHAQILKFSTNAPFMKIPVLHKVGEDMIYIWKHTSKLSNFKGKASS